MDECCLEDDDGNNRGCCNPSFCDDGGADVRGQTIQCNDDHSGWTTCRVPQDSGEAFPEYFEDDEDEDWMWENGCRPDYCTSWAEDCCASMNWGEPATCANGYSPWPPSPGDDCQYTCCPASNDKDDGPDAASTSTIIASVAAAVCLVLIAGLGILYLKIQRLQRPDAPVDGHVVAVEMAHVEQTAPPSYVSKGQPPMPGQNFCIDCGAALRGPFCGECGRRQTSALPAEETSEGTHV